MSLFILFSALLVLAGSLFATYPLFKKQRALAIGVMIGLPLMTFGLYKIVGTPQAFDASTLQQQDEPAPDLNSALSALQAELTAHPDNTEGWVLLARTKMTMGSFQEADAAFKQAIMLAPDDPDLKAERAEVLLRLSKDRSFSPEAVDLLKQALEQNPDHERALFLMGMHLLQQGDFPQAEIYLNKLLPRLNGEAATALREQINIARKQQGKPALEQNAGGENANSPHLKVSVSLDKSLASSIKPGAVLFVFAKSVNGGGPPVAAKRIEVGSFPVTLELSDADSLMPTANLSSQEKVSLSARISMQGIANAQAGDIEAEAVVTDTSNKNPVEIKLSRVKR